LFITLIFALLASALYAERVAVVAGGGSETTGQATRCRLHAPFGIDFDQSGNMYIAEMEGGERVLRVDARGMLTVFAGTGEKGDRGDDGPATQAQFNAMHSLAVGPADDLYIADTWNNRVRRIDAKSGKVFPFAGTGRKGFSGDGGPATAASLNMPHELRFDAAGNMYIAERDNHVIRKVTPGGIISTVAGVGKPGYSGDGGPGAKAELRQPHSLIIDRDGSLLICDIGNQRIRRLRLDTGMIETYAGTGEPRTTPEGAAVSGASLNGPRTMALAPNGDLYLALREGNMILKIDRRTETFHRVAGTGEQGYSGDGGPALAAKLGGPKGLALAPDGRLFVADTENHAIRVIDPRTSIISTVLGTGERGDGPENDPRMCRLSRPHGVFFGNDTLYVTSSEAHRIFALK
jgi:DNA-binding beta-propeller fold protein YncE